MNDSADSGQKGFSTLFYILHWLVVAGAICAAIFFRMQTPELEELNDGLRGGVERLIGQREQLEVLEKKLEAIESRRDNWTLANPSIYYNESRLERRIRTFESTNLTKYLPDDFTNLRSDAAEVKSDDEQNWIFAYSFREYNDRDRYYLLGVFSSRKRNDRLRAEVRETNSEYLVEGSDLIAVHEVKNIRPGWNFLTCEITKLDDDIRLTARLTDKTLQPSGADQLDFGSLKTMLNLDVETLSSADVERIWDGRSYLKRFVYCQSDQDKNPENTPLGSLKLKSPSKVQGKHLRIDFRLSQ